ncbi:MAG: hypothetical protein ACLQVI_23615 [Polyangiaceae bacterium]
MSALSTSESERAKQIAARLWRSRPNAPLDEVLAAVQRALAILPTRRPETLSKSAQRRWFDAVRVVAGVRVAMLEGGALHELLELDAMVNTP